MPDFMADFSADFSQFNEACAGAEQALGGVVDKSETVSPNVEKQAEAAGKAIRDFAKATIDAASEYVNAYADEERATNRLIAALRTQGTASDETIKNYDEMSKQFQNTTRFADDAIVKAQTTFTTIGKVGPEQMQPAIKAAADLAAGMGIDIESAAMIMSRALASGGEKLGALGRILGDTVEKGASAEDIFDAINKKFGGQAAADMSTWGGMMDVINHKIDDSKEKVGGYIATALRPLLENYLQLSPATQDVIAATAGMGGEIGGLAMKFAGVVSSILPLVTAISGAGGLAGAWASVSGALAPIVPYLGPAGIIAAGVAAWAYVFKNADVFVWAFSETWKGLTNAIASAYDSISKIVQQIYEAIKTWLVDKIVGLRDLVMAPIKGVVDAYQWMADKIVLHSIVPDMMNAIGDQFGRLPSTMVEPTKAAAAETTKSFQAAMDAMNEAWIKSPFNLMSHNLMLTETDAGGVARDLFGRPTMPIPGLPKTYGQQSIVVNVNGSVLSTQEQLARVMKDALMGSYRAGGYMLPT